MQQILFAKNLIPTLKKSELLIPGGPEILRLNCVLYNFGLHFGQNLFLQAIALQTSSFGHISAPRQDFPTI